jgi:GNAT superfamily N-acetyltransferase
MPYFGSESGQSARLALWDYPTTMVASFDIRLGEPDDLAFLGEMLYEAGFPPWAERPPLADAIASPPLAVFIEGWGRDGDTAVIAVEDGRSVGAAWYRVFDDAATRPRSVRDSETPEVVIAVVPDRRGAGIGGALLEALKTKARADGFVALSLGVSELNPAVRLYERHGFVRRIETSPSRWTMRCDLAL